MQILIIYLYIMPALPLILLQVLLGRHVSPPLVEDIETSKHSLETKYHKQKQAHSWGVSRDDLVQATWQTLHQIAMAVSQCPPQLLKMLLVLLITDGVLLHLIDAVLNVAKTVVHGVELVKGELAHALELGVALGFLA